MDYQILILILKLVSFVVGLIILSVGVLGFRLYFNGDLARIKQKDMSLGDIYRLIRKQ